METSKRKHEADTHDLTSTKVIKIDEESSDSQTINLVPDDNSSVSKEADEIVEKICKNGKVMTLTEGDNFIKVIVYEDSQENADDTLSAEEIERDCGAGNDEYRDPLVHGNILCDKSNTFSRSTKTSTGQSSSAPSSQSMGGSIQPEDTSPWYSLFSTDNQPLGCVTAASAIQSNFAQTVTQFAPPGLFACNASDIIQPVHMALQTDGQVEKQLLVEPASQNDGKIFCTPHPKNGQLMYYMAQSDKDEGPYPHDQSLAKHMASSTPVHTPWTPCATTSASKQASTVAPVALNSSGEETTSPAPRPVHIHNAMRMIELPAFVEENGRMREQHNQKERRRRARIKEACSLMRQLVPGMSDKTDKATVFEFAARYVHFLKSYTGNEHDKDFLMKYSPY